MNPTDFIRKWEKSTLKESAAAQSHFNDLCDLLDEPKPTDVDQTGETYCFEKGATKSTGGNGFADVWKKGCFGWEYKGPHKDLDRAHDQLLRYSVALENPPLLIVSDTKKIIIRTNWTNTIQEHHEIALTDLVDAAKRDLLKAAFSNPESLKPKRTRTQLTADAADEFSELAQRLRARRPKGEDEQDYARKVAHFVNRLVFCMFAEDVGLLPNKMFQKAMEMAERAPDKAQGFLQQLFAAMKDGGAVGFEEVPWFNGGLFDSDEALPMDRDDVALALKAAKLDWQDIDPSILGTLFQRGLDPSKRSQLGAHYTDRDKIMMIVNPVIVEPLTKEWENTKTEIAAELEKVKIARARVPKTQAEAKGVYAAARRAESQADKKARTTFASFKERLINFRVLDPACGSGNFLYLSLQALKDIEHKASIEFQQMLGDAELPGDIATPGVGPEAVKGIEINPYAAELARVSIWIGEIQWMRRNGFSEGRNPILRPLGNIECRDALIEFVSDADEWRDASWPDSDVIVGNPPFLGANKFNREIGPEETQKIRAIFSGRVPTTVDLVAYWFEKSSKKIAEGMTKRFGLVCTSALRTGNNLRYLNSIWSRFTAFEAWSDLPWTQEGANVRVSIICASQSVTGKISLDGIDVAKINSDLTDFEFGGFALAEPLKNNRGYSYQGSKKVGPFEVSGSQARIWLDEPLNPNGRPNSDVLKRSWLTSDFKGRDRDVWIVDFGTSMSEDDAALYVSPFAYVAQEIKEKRKKNARQSRSRNWWKHGDPQPKMRAAISKLDRYLVTPEVSAQRVFVWANSRILPDCKLMVIAKNDDLTFGILQSKFHELWSLYNGGVRGASRTYTPLTTFETFPFPEGLAPNISPEQYKEDPRATRISEAAARLNELRENWLNPPDMIKYVNEVVEGYPDRILPVDEKAEKILKRRTLTNLYNERPAWLDNAHRTLDEAVAAAYGWEKDFKSGKLTDEEILGRLFELNQQRARTQATAGKS